MNKREITVMVKAGSLGRSVESFGDNRFLVRIEPMEQDKIKYPEVIYE